MNKRDFNKFSWPKAMNLDLLAAVLDEVAFSEFIKENMFLDRKHLTLV
mgnify:CR=1 FL=1